MTEKAVRGTFRDLMPVVAAALDDSDTIVIVLEQVGTGLGGLRIIAANAAFRRSAGYGEEELAGQNFARLTQASADASALSELDEGIVSRSKIRGELCCVNLSGQPFWLGLHLMPVIEAGRPSGHFVLLGRDITEQRHNRAEQRAIQELLASVFLSVDAAVAIVDGHDVIQMANPELHKLFGYAPGELTGRLAVDLMPPESRDKIVEARQRQLVDQHPYRIDGCSRRKDGTTINITCTSVVVERRDLQRFRVLTIRELPAAKIDNEPKRTRVAGSIRFIGLEKVQAALGERWLGLAERVMQTAEHVLRRRLGQADTLSRTDNHGFVISFAGIGEEEAIFRAAMISREIRTRLIGHGEEHKAIEVSGVAAALPEPASEGEALPALIEDQFNVRRAECEHEVRRRLDACLRENPCASEPVLTTAGRDVGLTWLALAPRAQRQIMVSATILPARETAHLDLGLLNFRLALENMEQAELQGRARQAYLVSLGAEAVESPRTLDETVRRVRRLPPALRRLLLPVLPIGEGAPRGRVQECASALRPLCQGFGFEFEDVEPLPHWLPLLQGTIVTVPMMRILAATTANSDRLAALLTSLHTRGSRLLALHTETRAQANELRMLGVDLISRATVPTAASGGTIAGA